MKLEIFEKANRTRIDIIRTYNYVEYKDEFTGQGSFRILIPITEHTIIFLTYGNYILFDEGVVGVIKGIKDTEDEATQIEVYGYLTNHILSYRSFLKTTKYYDTIPNILRAIVNELFITNEQIVRNIDFIKLSEDPKYIPQLEDKIAVQNTGDNSLDVMQEMVIPYGMGFELYPVIKNFNEATGQYSNLDRLEYRVLKPTDRTIGNPEGNIPVVFSFDLDNLSNLEYEEDGRDYNTVAIVASEGTGQERKIIEVGELEQTGIDRIELYVDARDIQTETTLDDGTTQTITNEELENLMKQRGIEKLSEHKRFVSFNGSVITGNMSYEYKKDFFKGDYVSVYNTKLNLIVNLQITAVMKTISNGVEYFDIDFGYDRMVMKKISDRRKILYG